MRLVLAEQRDLFSGVPAAPVSYASLPPFPDPGPLPKGAGKMLGKSERRIASTLPYHASHSPPVVSEESNDVTVNGPHRYFMRPIPHNAGRHELIDRTTGEVITSGLSLNVWSQALRRNGISLAVTHA